MICLFTVGYVCFLYMEEDSWSLSLQVTKMMDRLTDYSINGTLLSIIGGVNIQSPEMNNSSVKFFNIVNNVGVKSARKIM